MSNRRRLQNRLAKLLAQYDKEIRDAFLAAIRSKANSINLRDLANAIEARDFNRALNIAGITRADLFPFDTSITSAYVAGGQTVPAAAPAFAASFGFDGRATRAEAWARNHVGGLVTNIVDEQIDLLRETIGGQIAQGVNPREAALDIAGRVGPGNVRQGGIVGLDAERARRLRVVTEAIMTPDGVRSLVIERRDGTVAMRYKVNKRTENAIRRAHMKGVAVPAESQRQLMREYGNALLKDRADTIARTESITALRAGRREGIQQGIEAGAIARDAVKRRWDATLDSRTRSDHVATHGQEVDGMDTPFVLPDGSRMLYPGDTSLGASASQTIQCRCYDEYVVDWLRG